MFSGFRAAIDRVGCQPVLETSREEALRLKELASEQLLARAAARWLENWKILVMLVTSGC